MASSTLALSIHASWQDQLRDAFTSVNELFEAGLISAEDATRYAALGERYKLRLTPYYASLMSGAADCPIRRQALPSDLEDDPLLPEWAQKESFEIYGRPAPWHADAIGDVVKLAAPRLTHRYINRAILHLSSLCAMYCRFCFRKEHLNEREKSLYEGSLEPALTYLRDHREITELILTGGDPLSVSDAALEALFQRVSEVSHIRVLRIHSRMPVTLPQRLTPELCEILSREWGFQVMLVSHFNHPQELTPTAQFHLQRVLRRGVALYNQSVLMRGINDDAEVLTALFQTLYEWGVRPFYLHHPDWTPGTFGFRVSIERHKALARQLRGRLPGPAVPQSVLDLPQGFGKVPLDWLSFEKAGPETHAISGAVYQTTPSHTKSCNEQSAGIRYLDLWR